MFIYNPLAVCFFATRCCWFFNTGPLNPVLWILCLETTQSVLSCSLRTPCRCASL